MPLYEYACERCGRQFELLVRSDTVPACPDCGTRELKKLLSTFAVGTAGSSSHHAAPSPCDSCGNPGGPGSCGMHD